eukprot:jgi/Botrbrau1/19299/Bobra.0073s0042.1
MGMQEGETEDAECAICHQIVHCSAVECACCPGRYVCLHDAERLCDCPPEQWRLAYRHSLAELEDMLQAVKSRVPEGYAEVAQLPPLEYPEEPCRSPSPDGEPGSEPDDMEVYAGSSPEVQLSQGKTPKKRAEKVRRTAAPQEGRKTRAALKAEAEGLTTISPLQFLADHVEELAEKLDSEEKAFPAERLAASPEVEPAGAAELPSKMEVEGSPDVAMPLAMPWANGEAEPQPPELALSPAPEVPQGPTTQEIITNFRQQRMAWYSSAEAVMNVGSAKASEVDRLIVEANQFLWGTKDVAEGVLALQQRLRDAKDWLSKVNALIKVKGSLEAVGEVVAWSPPPIHVPNFNKLREQYQAAQAWKERATPFLPEGTSIDLRTLELLTYDASKIQISLPEAKTLRERLTAARKMAEAIRAALPGAQRREPTPPPVERRSRRPRDPGDLPVAAPLASAKAAPPAPAPAITVEYLRSLLVQASACRVELPEAQLLLSYLDRSDAFQARCKEVFRGKAQLADLQALEKEGADLPAVQGEMSNLRRIISKACDWQHQAAVLARQRAPLKRMRDLLHAGVRLACEVPEVENLRREIRGREWEDAVRKALNGRPLLAILMEKREEAIAMEVQDSELGQALESRIATAMAWDERASTFLAAAGGPLEACPSLHDLQDIVAGGLEVGCKMESLARLEGLLASSGDWTQRAAALVTSDLARRPLRERPTLPDLEAMLESGKALGIRMAQIRALSSKIAQAEDWTARVKQLIDTPISYAHQDSLQELLDEGQGLGLQMDELHDLEERLHILDWNQRARKMLLASALSVKAATAAAKAAAAKPKLAVLVSPSEGSETAAPAAALLPSAHAAKPADAKARAQDSPGAAECPAPSGTAGATEPDLSSAGGHGAGGMGEVPQTSGGGAVVGPAPCGDELAGSPAHVVAPQTAAASLTGIPETGVTSPEAHQELECVALSQEPPTLEAAEPMQAVSDVQAEPLAAGGGGSLLALLTEEVAVEDKGAAGGDPQHDVPAEAPEPLAQPTLSSGELGPSPMDVDDEPVPASGTLEADENLAAELVAPAPTLQEAESLLKEAAGMVVDESLRDGVRELVDAASLWITEAKKFLSKASGSDDILEHTPEAAEQLIQKGSLLGLETGRLAVLKQSLSGFRDWELEAAAALNAEGTKPAFALLKQLCQRASSLPFASPLLDSLTEAVDAAEAWQEDLRKVIVKRNSSIRLDRAVAALRASLDRATMQLQICDEREKKAAAAAAAAAAAEGSEQGPNSRRHSGAGDDSDEDEHDLYCLCQQPYNVDTAMVKCDACTEWFHLKCMGLTQSAARSIKKYNCPLCEALRGNKQALETALAKTRRTRRPLREKLLTLTKTAGLLSCEVAEQSTLAEIINKFDLWQEEVGRQVMAHDTACQAAVAADSTQDRAPGVSVKTLSSLTLSALSVEVECGELTERLMAALHLAQWRLRARTALHTSSNLTVEVLMKLAKEGEALPGDGMAAAIMQKATAAKQWVEKARKLVADLKAGGGDENEARKVEGLRHAELAETIAAKIDKDLAALKKACDLYCICRQVYDDDRPMVGCDYCNGWYHYECVGLRAPKMMRTMKKLLPQISAAQLAARRQTCRTHIWRSAPSNSRWTGSHRVRNRLAGNITAGQWQQHHIKWC